MNRGTAHAAIRIASWCIAAFAILGLVAACQSARLGGTDVLDAPAGGVLRLATHNVHYISTRDEGRPWSIAGWEARRDELDAAFRALRADAVAFQEMETFAGGSISYDNLALDWLLARNPDYAAAATGDPDLFPSTQPILYRTERLEILDEGWFFFSPTPEVVYSRGFDGASPSFASWARFRDRRDGTAFTLVNVHFDYGSWVNRQGAAELTPPSRSSGSRGANASFSRAISTPARARARTRSLRTPGCGSPPSKVRPTT